MPIARENGQALNPEVWVDLNDLSRVMGDQELKPWSSH
jgi:hypothetical protein